MAGFDRKAIKKLAARQTSDRASYKEILIHTLVSLAAALLIIGVDYVLTQQIGHTGGLSGMGTRSVLETVRTVLQYANLLLVPFWEMGIFYWAIRRARGQQTAVGDFLEGLRRFAPVFRLKLIQTVVFGAIYMFCVIISSVVFTLSPLGWPLIQFVMNNIEDPTAMAMMADEALMAQMLQMMWPVFIILALMLIPAMVPLYYRFRMAEYVIMDKPHTGAIYSLIRSFQLTKGQFVSLLKTDLSYWWFWGLQFLSAAFLYLDLLLPALGITALDLQTQSILCYAASYTVQFVSLVLFRGRIETAYALIYNARNATVPAPKPIMVQPNDPWIEQ